MGDTLKHDSKPSDYFKAMGEGNSFREHILHTQSKKQKFVRYG
jgi:hypothetical protein